MAADLRDFVHADYRRLEDEVPGVVLRRCGALDLTGAAARADVGGGDVGRGRVVVTRAEIARLEPRLRAAEIPEHAVYAPDDAGVDPAELTCALTRAAQGMGARVICRADVRSVREVSRGSTRGVVSSAGFHPADVVVLTAGAGTAAFPFGVRVDTSPACSLRIAAQPGAVRTILVGAGFEVREVRDGQLVATIPYSGGGAEAADTDDADAESLERHVRRCFARIQAAFEGGDAFRLLDYGVAERPVPADGPIVGYVTPDQSVYVAVMHSGLTLAPTVGRLVAEELAGRRRS